jgi:hypothetical protein
MTVTTPGRSFRKGLTGFLLAFLLGCATQAAKANTYQFSFTASQVLSALQTSHASDVNDPFLASAYFAIFVQPDPAQISGYSINPLSLGIPNPTDPNAWQASIINDPSNPALGYGLADCTANCDWAGFYKNTPTQATGNATVISANNLGPQGSNIFLGSDRSDNALPPFGWGGQTYDFVHNRYVTVFDQVINSIMPGNDAFTFTINTSQTLSGTYTLLGYASALVSGSTTLLTGTKDDGGIAFSMQFTFGSATPEPATWASMFGGVLVLAAFLCLRRSRDASAITALQSNRTNTRSGD